MPKTNTKTEKSGIQITNLNQSSPVSIKFYVNYSEMCLKSFVKIEVFFSRTSNKRKKNQT